MSDSALTYPQFVLLQAIARQSCSASELAREADVSLPYVLSQLKLLEAKSLIKKYPIKDKSVGKPKQYYEVHKAMIDVTLLTKQYAGKFSLSTHSQMQIFFQVLGQLPKDAQHHFSNYYWTNINHLEQVQAYALLSTARDSIELLGITTAEQLDELRRNASSFKTRSETQRFSIACWMHTIEEIQAGLASKDEYYLRLLTQARPLVDPKHVFDTLGKER